MPVERQARSASTADDADSVAHAASQDRSASPDGPSGQASRHLAYAAHAGSPSHAPSSAAHDASTQLQHGVPPNVAPSPPESATGWPPPSPALDPLHAANAHAATSAPAVSDGQRPLDIRASTCASLARRVRGVPILPWPTMPSPPSSNVQAHSRHDSRALVRRILDERHSKKHANWPINGVAGLGGTEDLDRLRPATTAGSVECPARERRERASTDARGRPIAENLTASATEAQRRPPSLVRHATCTRVGVLNGGPTMRTLRVTMCAVVLAMLGACSDDGAGSSPAPAQPCTPNASVACTCAAGCVGAQTCNAQGTGFVAACDCSACGTGGTGAAGATGGAGGTDVTGGTGGIGATSRRRGARRRNSATQRPTSRRASTR